MEQYDIPDVEDRTREAQQRRWEILAAFEFAGTPSMRREMGLPPTQRELAELLGVTSGAVSQWKKSRGYQLIAHRVLRENFGPERMAHVLDNMFAIAMGSTPQAPTAAKILIQFSKDAVEEADPEEEIEALSDEELDRLLEKRLEARGR